MKRLTTRLFVICIVLSTFSPTLAWSNPRYSPAQINAMLARAKADYVKKATAQNPRVADMQRRIQRNEQLLQQGFCKRVKIIKTETFCIKSHGNRMSIFVDGRYKPTLSKIAGALKKVIQSLSQAYQKVDNDLRGLKNKLAQTIRTIEKQEAFNFDRKIQTLKTESLKRARALLKMPEWQKKVVSKVTGKIVLMIPKVVMMMRSEYIKELHKVLKKSRNLEKLRQLAKVHKAGLYTAKAHGKGVVIAIALSAAFNAANPVINCWAYSGSAKRNCLQREIASATANMAFDVASALISVSMDIIVIEPLSHALATKVSAALAALSAGIGALGYPIVYGSCSVALNGMIIGIMEIGFRTAYNQLIKPKMVPVLSVIPELALRGLSNEEFKCWGPKSLCK